MHSPGSGRASASRYRASLPVRRWSASNPWWRTSLPDRARRNFRPALMPATSTEGLRSRETISMGGNGRGPTTETGRCQQQSLDPVLRILAPGRRRGRLMLWRRSGKTADDRWMRNRWAAQGHAATRERRLLNVPGRTSPFGWMRGHSGKWTAPRNSSPPVSSRQMSDVLIRSPQSGLLPGIRTADRSNPQLQFRIGRRHIPN